MKKLIIFDADSIIWTIAYKYRNKKVRNLMLISLNNFIKEVIENSKATHYIGFYASKEEDRKPNYRYSIDPNYKAQRPPEPDWIAKWRPVIQEEMTEKWNFVPVDGLEADDAVSICAHHYQGEYDEIIVATVDKDLKQIPNVTYYNYSKHTTEQIDEVTAARELGIQVLSGDTADNVKGLYKVGPVKAKNHLSMCGSVTEITWSVIRYYIEYAQDMRKKVVKEITNSAKEEVKESDWAKGKTEKQIERKLRITLANRIEEAMERRLPGGWKAYFRTQYGLLKLLTEAPDYFDIPEPTKNELVSTEKELSENATSDDFMYL
jgi:5'-3' exonuclease